MNHLGDQLMPLTSISIKYMHTVVPPIVLYTVQIGKQLLVSTNIEFGLLIPHPFPQTWPSLQQVVQIPQIERSFKSSTLNSTSKNNEPLTAVTFCCSPTHKTCPFLRAIVSLDVDQHIPISLSEDPACKPKHSCSVRSQHPDIATISLSLFSRLHHCIHIEYTMHCLPKQHCHQIHLDQ